MGTQKDKSKKLRWRARVEGLALPDFDEPLPTANVRAPGEAALHAVGPRAIDPARPHWYPTGPRNIGGRIRALAIHPSDDRTLFVGTASGGVFKTDNRGETWFPLWHDEPSLSIAAIAICRDHPDIIYVATGEPFHIPGAGVFRSLDGGRNFTRIATAEALNGSVFIEQIAVHPERPGEVWVVGPRGVFRSRNADDATAANVTFHFFDEGRPPESPTRYSDAVFGGAASGAPDPFVLYLVRSHTERGEIVRIDRSDASDADITTALAAPTQRARVFAAAGAPPAAPTTIRGKLTVCRDRPEIVYAAFTHESQAHQNRPLDEELRAVVRCRNANQRGGASNFSTTTWTALPYRSGADLPDDFILQGQGGYNLTIAVHPRDPNVVFFGMVSLFVCTNANGTSPAWHPAIQWELWRFDRARHADQHALVFEQQSASPELWLGNDGGVVVTDGLAAFLASPTHPDDQLVAAPAPVHFRFREATRAMTPEGALRFRRRIHGLNAVQAYDLTQSPLVPSLYACGLQDNGVWYTAGGDTWRLVMGADGGYVAFDPNDPYRFLATWQGAINTVSFSGSFDRAVPPPDVFVNTFEWPRQLSQGFLRQDRSRFVADTVHHPRKSARAITTRTNRAYATSNGETFAPLPVGGRVELIASFRHAQPTPTDLANRLHDGMIMLEVRDTPAATKLGFYPGVVLSTRNETRNPREADPPPNPPHVSEPFATNLVALRSLTSEPYALSDGDELEVRLRGRERSGAEHAFTITVTFRTVDFPGSLGAATAEQVARYLRTKIVNPAATATFAAELSAQHAFGSAALSVELVTASRTSGGVTSSLELSGTLGLPERLGVAAGRYEGLPGRPAMVSLHAFRLPFEELPFENISVPDGAELRIRVDGGPTRSVTFRAPPFGDLDAIRPGELADAINAALAGQPARAIPNISRKSLVIFRDDPGGNVEVRPGSTAVPALTTGTIPPGNPKSTNPPHELEARFIPGRLWNAFDLSPIGATAQRLVLRGDASTDVTIDFDAAGFVDRSRATVEEVAAKIRAALAGAPAARLRCEVVFAPSAGDPTEVVYSTERPDTLWLGGLDGVLYTSTDDGVHFRKINEPRFGKQMRAVEAIGIGPRDPQIVFVGLGTSRGTRAANPGGTDTIDGRGPHDPGTLFRSTDGGQRWQAIGLSDLVARDGTGAPLTPRQLLGVNEIFIDPTSGATLATTRLWVATHAGVFESTDGGEHFRPMNEGLPNGRVLDLAFEPERRLLRCAVWGRGIYTRPVDASSGGARLYLRLSSLDDGRRSATVSAHDGPDGFAPTPTQAPRWESPDIKVSPLPFTPELGATPDEIDGAEFDDDIDHEPLAHYGSTPQDQLNVFVQVHNGSGIAVDDVRVIVLWADVRGGIPPLGGTFWAPANLQAATPTIPAGAWNLVGAASITGAVVAERPRVVRIPFTPPPDLAAQTDEVGLLAIVTRTSVATGADTTDVVALLEREPRVAFRTTRTRGAREARRLLLLGEDGATFTASETPAGGLGLAAGAPIGHLRSQELPRDLRPSSGTTPRRLQITSGGTTATARFLAPDFVDLANARAPEVRRVLNRALRLGRVPVRCRLGEVRLSVRGLGRSADLIAAAAAIADPVDRFAAFGLTPALRKGTLRRSAPNHLLLRVSNLGDAPEPSLRYRIYAVDAAAAPFRVRPADEIATGTVSDLEGGERTIIEVPAPYDPGAAAGVSVLALVVSVTSEGTPLRAPFAEPPPAEVSFTSLAALATYCELNENVAFRVFALES